MFRLQNAPMHGEHVTPVLDSRCFLRTVDCAELGFQHPPLTLDVHAVNKQKLSMHHGLRVVRPHVVPAMLGHVASAAVQLAVDRMHI